MRTLLVMLLIFITAYTLVWLEMRRDRKKRAVADAEVNNNLHRSLDHYKLKRVIDITDPIIPAPRASKRKAAQQK